MGSVIGTVIGVVGCMVLGVFQSIIYAKNKNKDKCRGALKWELFSAITAFTAAIIILLIFLISHAIDRRANKVP
jgi:hypothetical protein